MIIPYLAGGGADSGGRLLAAPLSEELGVPVVPENIPGAGGQIGITELTSAKPDGCTIGWTHLPATITMYDDPSREAPFKRENIEPIATFVVDWDGLYVQGDSPYKTLSDLVDAAKQAPDTIPIGFGGILSDGHLLILNLEEQTGAKFREVSTTGGQEAVQFLLGGHIAGMASNISGPNIQLTSSGQLRLLATFSKDRSSDYPGVMTATEQGVPLEISSTRILSAPGGTPQNIIDRLSEAVGQAMQTAELKEKTAKLGLNVSFLDATATRAYWDATEAQLTPLVSKYLAEKDAQ
jgi:tripartite-type tricarboxylate transporter receptor subunit TctC